MIINKTPGVGLNDAVEDSFQAFLVDGAYFTHKEEYPILHEDMVSKKPPKKIYAWLQCYAGKAAA